MTSLTAIFGSSEEEDGGKSEKLLELYWNRAQLKKEFAKLRDETYRLKDQVKTQQGCTARAQQKFEHLERLLLDRDWAPSVMVFYQLRALNERAKQRVARFAEQLKQQREKREHSRLVGEWDAKRRGDARVIEKEISDLQARMQDSENRLQFEHMRFSMMNAFMRFFRKRAISRTLDAIAADISAARDQEQVMRADLARLNERTVPDTQGLAIGSKRSINLMIVSFAQQLYLYFADGNLAAVTKESGERSVGSMNYGDRSDCDFILEAIAEVGEALNASETSAEKLQLRASFLRENAVFTYDDEAVPEADSIACIFDVDPSGVVRKRKVDLLGENYWDLQKILSR